LAVLAIAGSGRGAGKTAVGCALIAAMPELRWVAVKITPHRHGIAGTGPIFEEFDSASEKDTGRYLAAGAARALLISGVGADAVESALTPALEAIRAVPEAGSLLIESNRIEPRLVAKPAEPVFCLAVVAGSEPEWKPSLNRWLAHADALVLTGGVAAEALSSELRRRPVFCLPQDRWVTAGLLHAVRRGLGLA
jgi:hypothetical protein